MTSVLEHPLPHILLVDACSDDLTLIQQSCADGGVPAVFHLAQDGAEALACISRLSQQGSLPNLIVLDILLPVTDGFQVLQELRRRSDIPVLILTASADMGHVGRSFRMGADLYLYKPVVYDDRRVIAQRMAELLEHQPLAIRPGPGEVRGGTAAGEQGEDGASARRAW